MTEFNKTTFTTAEYKREFQKDIDVFIRLNRSRYYYPKLSEENRIIRIDAGYRNNNNVGSNGCFIVTVNLAIREVMLRKFDIPDRSAVIISNRRVQSRAELYISSYMFTNEVERILQRREIKSWVIDNDYKDILIINFGDYEVRTGLLTGLDEPLQGLSALSEKEKKERIELNKNYPHYCYSCGKRLKFSELLATQAKKKYEWLKNLWMSENVEFLCCKCYWSKKIASQI